MRPYRFSSRLLRAVVPATAFLTFAASAVLAQETVKIPRALPHMEDLKLPAPPPDGRESAAPPRILPPSAEPARFEAKIAGESTKDAAVEIDVSKVFFDEAGDGRIWARGRAYKASFDREGATYIPFLGSNAPRNFPVHVRLDSARIGAVELPTSVRTFDLRGDEVHLDRVSMREVWKLTPADAEQSFVLSERPAAAGSLVLRLALETELTPHATSTGIELVGEFGGVSISRVVAVDAAGIRTELESQLVDGALLFDVPAELLAAARYPLVLDPVYSTNAADLSTTVTSLPDIANGDAGGKFATAYQYAFSATDSDVWTMDVFYGAPVAGSGTWVDATTSSWLFPRIAFNALHNTYLTVCAVRATPSSPGEIWCRARTGGSTSQFAPTLIQNSLSGSCFYPDVGGDPLLVGPTYFLVAWTRNFSATDWDVHARLVAFDGTPQGTSPIFLANSTAFDWFPRVSKTDGRGPSATQEWNVVWMRNGDVFGSQIHWDGFVTTPAFPIDQSSFDDTYPSASSPLDGASGARPWMVTYRRQFATEGDVYAKVLTGSTVQAELNVSVYENVFLEDQVDPDVDSNGQRFVVAYGESYQGSAVDHDAYAATLHFADGAIGVDEAHQVFDPNSLDTRFPQISCSMTASNQGFPYYGLAWSGGAGSVEHAHVGAYYEPAPYETFCYGTGPGANCPCGNSGGSGKGCANSVTNGSNLFLQGNAFVSQDTFQISAFNLPPGTIGLFFQATAPSSTPVQFGDGLLCATGTIMRLAVKAAPAGVVNYPESGDARISIQGGLSAGGGFRMYQFWYRDAAGSCSASTFNLSSAARVLWLR